MTQSQENIQSALTRLREAIQQGRGEIVTRILEVGKSRYAVIQSETRFHVKCPEEDLAILVEHFHEA